MKIAITGSSGLLGTALRAHLAADGHELIRIVRRPATAADEISWDPADHRMEPDDLSGVDAVIHLAGLGIGDRRWTAAVKRQLRDSRVEGTATISRAVAAAQTPPRVLISASAVGFYGHAGSRQVDETSLNGQGFLAELCRDWEAATAPAKVAGVRVATIRTGLVLAPNGGALAPMRRLFALGMGGRLGSGKQYWPWISLLDELDAIRFLLDHDVAGPVNLTGPVPVTNAEFSRALGSVMHRPALVPAPAFALRAVLGEFADEGVLASQRAVPAVLHGAGFTHSHTTVEQALRWALTSS